MNRVGSRWALFVVAALVTRCPAAEVPRLVLQAGHGTGAGPMAVSLDGRLLVTAGAADDNVILWDVATTREVRRLPGHESGTMALAFSPDGKALFTGGGDKKVRHWSVAEGQLVRTLAGHENTVFALAVSPDGRRVLTGSWDGTARLWDAATGKEVLRLEGHKDYVTAVAFAPDGRLVTGGRDQTIRLWDPTTGKALARFDDRAPCLSLAWLPDGKRLVAAGGGGVLRVWDVETGRVERAIDAHKGTVWRAAVVPGGKEVLSSDGATLRRHDLATGDVRVSAPLAVPGRFVALSPDGRHAFVNHEEVGALRVRLTERGFEETGLFAAEASAPWALALSSQQNLAFLGGLNPNTWTAWDLGRGAPAGPTRSLSGAGLVAAALTPDGRTLFAAGLDRTVRRFAFPAMTEAGRFGDEKHPIRDLALSPDGRRVATAGRDGTARLWDAASGREVRRLGGHTDIVEAVAFSPDSTALATASRDKTVVLWDAAAGRETGRLRGHEDFVLAVAYGPDGTTLATAGRDNAVILWDIVTGKEVRRFSGHEAPVTAVAFSPDGKRLLTSGFDRTARVWDLAAGRQLRLLGGHTGWVRRVAWTPDGRHALSSSLDKTTRLWDVEGGRELVRLVTLHDGTWAATDTAGRFDASHGGDVNGLHWVVGLEPIALKQLKDRYYDPGLLAKYLGFNKEPLRDVATLSAPKLHPAIAVAGRDARLDVTLTNRGGGIGKVVVLVNGKELASDTRPRGADADAAKMDLQLDLSADPRLVPGRKNIVEVFAYNAEGYLSSRSAVREFDGPGPANADPPTVHAIVAGVSEYRGGKLNLRYAAKDADDFAAALRLAAGRLFGTDKVRLTLLTGARPEGRATRPALEKALAALKATKPGDIVVVYLAGHGVTHGGQDGDWHYLAADAQSADLADPEVRKQVSLSSAELTDLLKAAPAKKQVLVLDTCHSGRVVEKLTEKRDVPGSQIRALERVKDRSGVHVLAGCAADAVSYEASRYGQGLLTYSLLLGLRGAKLREGEYVDVVDLFSFAADKVPELARDVGGVQRPTVASPKGASFDIGRLTVEDRAKVPLQAVKPVVVRASFQEEKRVRDVLGLSRRVNERLRDLSVSGRGAKLVYVDAEEFPGAVQAAGRYKAANGKVTVSVSLFEGEKELASFTVEGEEAKPDDLAARVTTAVERHTTNR